MSGLSGICVISYACNVLKFSSCRTGITSCSSSVYCVYVCAFGGGCADGHTETYRWCWLIMDISLTQYVMHDEI